VTSLLSRLRLKKGSFVLHHSQAVYSQESDTLSKGGSYYQAKQHIREYLIVPELLMDNLSDVPEDIFLRKLRFCERNKNCAVRKNTVKVEHAPRKVTILQMRGQPRG
jgi:hypothetical protein